MPKRFAAEALLVEMQKDPNNVLRVSIEPCEASYLDDVVYGLTVHPWDMEMSDRFSRKQHELDLLAVGGLGLLWMQLVVRGISRDGRKATDLEWMTILAREMVVEETDRHGTSSTARSCPLTFRSMSRICSNTTATIVTLKGIDLPIRRINHLQGGKARRQLIRGRSEVLQGIAV